MAIQYNDPIPYDEAKLIRGWTREASVFWESSDLTFYRDHDWYSHRDLDVSLAVEKANEDGVWIMCWSDPFRALEPALVLQVLEVFGFRNWVAEPYPSGMVGAWASSHAPSVLGREIAENAYNTFPPPWSCVR